MIELDGYKIKDPTYLLNENTVLKRYYGLIYVCKKYDKAYQREAHTQRDMNGDINP